jgi:hypothetical protein
MGEKDMNCLRRKENAAEIVVRQANIIGALVAALGGLLDSLRGASFISDLREGDVLRASEQARAALALAKEAGE